MMDRYLNHFPHPRLWQSAMLESSMNCPGFDIIIRLFKVPFLGLATHFIKCLSSKIGATANPILQSISTCHNSCAAIASIKSRSVNRDSRVPSMSISSIGHLFARATRKSNSVNASSAEGHRTTRTLPPPKKRHGRRRHGKGSSCEFTFSFSPLQPKRNGGWSIRPRASTMEIQL